MMVSLDVAEKLNCNEPMVLPAGAGTVGGQEGGQVMKAELVFSPEGGGFGGESSRNAGLAAVLPLDVLDMTGNGFLVLAESGHILTVSHAAARLFGYDSDELRERPVGLLLPDWPGEFDPGRMAPGRVAYLTGRHRTGESFPLGVAVGRLVMADPMSRVLMLYGVTDQGAADRRSQRLLTIIEESNDEIFVVVPGGWRFQLVNRRARDNLGYAPAEFDQLTLLDINPGLDAEQLVAVHRRLRDTPALEITLPGIQQRRNGSTYEVNLRLHLLPSDSTPLLAVLARDTSEATRNEAILQQHSFYDQVTMLPNRVLFRDRLRRVLDGRDDRSATGAVLVISLDTIALVNECLGPADAETLGREVARRLSDAVQVRDTVARVGDAEFAVMIDDQDGDEDAGALAERILSALHRPFQLGDYQVMVPVAIGIATFPDNGRDADTILGNAATALLGVREDFAVGYRFFTDGLNLAVKNRVALNNGLSRAMEREEFSLVYQPKVDLVTWQVRGVEALLRWRNLDLGSVPPDVFVPVLERTGLMSEVGDWVLEAACDQRRRLKEAGFTEVRMAINLSVRQVRREFLGTLRSALAGSGLEPGDIELEITESVIVKDGQAAVGLLREIADMGIPLSMDDFGCGYSSLSHLRRLPLDTIKIDRSFITDLASDPEDAEIVRAIINMGHALRRRVIAEGVETIQQLAVLRRFGCDEIQGYLYSPPVPGRELMALLARARVPLR